MQALYSLRQTSRGLANNLPSFLSHDGPVRSPGHTDNENRTSFPSRLTGKFCNPMDTGQEETGNPPFTDFSTPPQLLDQPYMQPVPSCMMYPYLPRL